MKTQTQNEPNHAVQDLGLLNELTDLCQQGLSFYQRASRYTDDYNLKRTFTRMADIRQRILTRLPSAVAAKPQQSPHSTISVQDTSAVAAPHFQQATTALEQDKLPLAIKLVVDTELHTLRLFKQSVRQASDHHIANQLAESAAWLQICTDEMQALKKLHLAR